ncbi:MAG: tyrosine--tRNA ligase [Alphaproteobacteria bacterium]|nr:tyrosine--tRNA ligase [Alphaproteobacteria bacterium]
MKPTLVEDLTWRGLIHQTTYKHIEDINKKGIVFYWGVDPSGDSLTVGHLAGALFAKRLIEGGHKAVLLVGGATGRIGDPDGKKQERNLLSEKVILSNVKNITSQYKKLFNSSITVVDNYSWFKNIPFLSFLRDVGKHVPMSKMLAREFIKTRLDDAEAGISYAEFSYSLMQGYDFVHLNRTKKVTLQICGSDQWGNSIAGVDLLRRLDAQEAHILSFPLVVNPTTGVKFGKTESGTVWLDEKKTSVYAFYQFWLNTPDEVVIQYLKIFTFLSREKIETLEQEKNAHPEKRESQKTLARLVTEVVHGKEKTASVIRITDILFNKQNKSLLKTKELTMLSKEVPIHIASKKETVVDCAVALHMVKSKNEGHTLYKQGGLVLSSTQDKKMFLLRKGKNTFALIRATALLKEVLH